MKNIFLTLLSFASLNFLHSQPVQDWKEKVSPALLQKTRDGADHSMIIFLSHQADVRMARPLKTKNEKAKYVFSILEQTARESQAEIIDVLVHYGASYKSLFIVNAIGTKGSVALVQMMAEREDVSLILDLSDFRYADPVDGSGVGTGSRSVITWGIEKIKADQVWSKGYRGQGVVIGGQDTGYEWEHPALKKQYRGYDVEKDTAVHDYHWHDAIHSISPLHADSLNPCGLDVPEPCDDRGHGTHTMGTMVGLDEEEEIGVAPEAQWCGCRSMERGWGSPLTYLECFQWFLAPTDLNNENPDPSLAPHVINNSWGCPEIEGCDSTNWEIMEMAVNHLRLAGIVVVVSAGNDGSDCGTVAVPAAMYEGSFSVGATAINDTIAGFSSRGPVAVDSSFRLKPNVSAPGVGIRSARLGGTYGNSSGTSMAGPHVAGLVALMISANPDLAGQVELIEDIIEQTAVPMTTDQNCGEIPGTDVPNHTYGFGRIDALAAVDVALELVSTGTHPEPLVQGIKVYPNPATNHLVFEFLKPLVNVQIDLYDLQGRLHFREHISSSGVWQKRISMHDKPSGPYLYAIRAEEKFHYGKVIKL